MIFWSELMHQREIVKHNDTETADNYGDEARILRAGNVASRCIIIRFD